MKTSGNYIKGYVIAILFSIPIIAYSQQSFWDMLYIGKALTLDNKFAVGENCIIFSETSSNKVYAFSTITGNWDSALIATALPWTDAAAGGKSAMLLNDSLAVFFSASNHDFTVLRFEGQLRNDRIKMVGCNATMGYVLTNTKVYVFDSDDSQIRSANYTSISATPYASVYNGNDYLCFNLSESDLTKQTIIAYSSITKTISEFTGVNLPLFRQLEHGFIYGRTTGPPYSCGGYSAFTGTFVNRTSDIIIGDVLHQYDLKRVYPRLCYLFYSRSDVDINGIATFYLWVFNTLTGTFDDFSYDFKYNLSQLVPNDEGTGGQGIFHITYDKDNGDKVNLITYDVYSGAFTQHDFNIVYDYRNRNYIGGHIIALITKDKLVFYDILSGNSAMYNSDWQAGQFPGIQSIELGNNYVTTVYYKGAGTQGMTVFNYNGTTDSIKNVSFASSNNYSDVFGSTGYSLVKFVNYTQAAEHLLYSVANDSWLVKSVASSGVYTGEKTGFYFHIDNNQNITTFFNAKCGTELTLPVKSQGTPYSLDSILMMHSSDKKYGYSSVTNSTASHPNFLYSNTEHRNTNIFIYHTPVNPDNPGHLLFDGNHGIFVTFNTNSQTHGTRILTRAGGKTALTVYNKGYLFAYDPGEYTSVDEESPSRPGSFQLYQNYPNPFTASTTITWQLPKAAHAILKVYDFTGREVKILVDCEQAKGDQKVNFDATGLPAGVYFYQLLADGKVETKKMVLIK